MKVLKGLRKIIKVVLPIDAVVCTVFVFALMAGFKDLFGRFDFLNPFDVALTDFDMTDLSFSPEIREEQEVDTNIVLVNIGYLPRRFIARELEIISRQNPRAVGIDASFLGPGDDPHSDSLLEAAMRKTKNLVLYSYLTFRDKNVLNGKGNLVFDSVEFCYPSFARYGTPGFVNLVAPKGNEFRICRSFCPLDSVNGRKFLSFGLQMAWFEDSLKVKDFLSRKNSSEIINYRGNSGHFFNLDHSDLIGRAEMTGFYNPEESPVNFRNKLVFMGFMGNSFAEADKTVEDKFFTPLNPNVAGKAYPDMFGVAVHANIASMVLRGKPVDSMGFGLSLILAVVLCYLNVLGFFYIHRNFPNWYDLSVKTIQILEVLLILYLAIYIYGVYQYKPELSLAAFAVGFSGDVLEIYVGLKEKIKNFLQRFFA
jgi:hypothetical protein